jgi:ubiquinone/menaquinone biosynthesis C-methylase UbiE
MRVTGELAGKWCNRLVFCQGSALALPYADEKFDKCYSVEAAQHFDDLLEFAAEVYRVVKSGGRLSVTTFFMPPTAAIEELRRLLPSVANGIDAVVLIDSFRNDLLNAGFDNVRL